MPDILFNLQDHIDKNKMWYESGMLVPEDHYMLVNDIQGICAIANVPPHFLTRSMKEECTAEEIDWFRNSKSLIKEGISGFCYTGFNFNEEKMFLMAAGFMRNYISTIFLSVQEVIDRCKQAEQIPQSVLFIPNFYVSKSSGGDLPTWQTSMLLGYLGTRISKRLLTVLYCENISGMSSLYGSKFAKIIESNYVVLEGS